MGGKGRKYQPAENEHGRRYMIQLSFILLSGILLSGCLLTHEDVREEIESETALQKQKNQESYQKEQGGVFSVQSRVGEMEESLRELRGQIDLLLKKQEDQEELNQNNQTQINNFHTSLDNLKKQMNSLTENLEQQKEAAKKLMESDPEYHFKEAEKFFNEENWKKAIVAYEQYRKKNKDGKLFKKATFQIGQCFQNLDMKKEAQVFFKEVVSSFPKSEEAKEAKNFLNTSNNKKPAKVKSTKKPAKKPAKKTAKKTATKK